MKNSILPKVMYKYYDFDTGIKAIISNTIKLSSPTEFNDPFDCYDKLIDFKVDKKEDVMQVLKRSLHKNPDLVKEFEEISRSPDRVEKVLYDTLLQARSKMGVSCFSRLFDQQLMWSHYSNKHTGICIGYEINPFVKDYFIIPVNYQKNLKKINYFEERIECIKNWLTQKSEDWSYEQEVRLISFETNGIVAISKESIKEVYLGCRVKNKQAVLDIISERQLGVKVGEMKLLEDEFGMGVDELIKGSNF